MSEVTEQSFSKWRSYLWPIHGFELKKVLPMFLMFFFISFNYTILRDTKDTLVVTAPGSGAEAIPFIKVWLVVPCAVVFLIVYAKLSNILSKQKLFFAVLIPFMVFFATFAWVLYPAKDILHPTVAADWLQSHLPQGMMGIISIFRNWTYAVFYVMAELWGSVMLSLVFWGFANDITRVSEAKRFYATFLVGANVALLFSGKAIVACSMIRERLPQGVDAWGVSLHYLMGLVFLSSIIIGACYWWINKYVLTDSRFYDPADVRRAKEKPKMRLVESFKFLAKSKYIGCLALLVIAYGIAINLIEVTWKSQLKMQYPNAIDYSIFMGNFSFVTGAVTIFMTLFIGGNLLRRKGWTFTALFTPVMLLITGVTFFAFVLFKDSLTGVTAFFGATPLLFAVMLGAIQNILTKSSKYSCFDPTKEVAYIPLDSDSKVKGKAAIDVVGARLGKSGGSLIQQGLIVGLGSIAAMAPYVAIVVVGVVVVWIFAGKSLGRQFATLTAAQQQRASEKATKEEAVSAHSSERVTVSS